MASSQQRPVIKHEDGTELEILEKGDIFFFYKPKVEVEDPQGVDDIQRMYIVLCPEVSGVGTEGKKKAAKEDEQGNTAKPEVTGSEEDEKNSETGESRTKRQKTGEEDVKEQAEGREEQKVQELKAGHQPVMRLIIVGRKVLPKAEKGSRPFWGYVDLVTQNPADIKEAFAPAEYETSTRGKRHQPAARAAGEGVYHIVRHKKGARRSGDHTHLVYKLELPSECDSEAQKELHIEKQASYVVQVKNPETPTPRTAGLQEHKAEFPEELQKLFEGRRFMPLNPPDFFNYVGCEMLLMGSADTLDDLGDEVKESLESCAMQTHTEQEIDEVLELLPVENESTLRPLLRGEWA
eukprot:jgi/Mesen1/10730/ME000090S10187